MVFQLPTSRIFCLLMVVYAQPEAPPPVLMSPRMKYET